jgi:Co/Zn/Cd efflux system component
MPPAEVLHMYLVQTMLCSNTLVILPSLGCILHESGVGHSHGGMHSHHHHSVDEKNINVRAAFIHVVGDTVQSIGVLIAALIIKFKVISIVHDNNFRRKIGCFFCFLVGKL